MKVRYCLTYLEQQGLVRSSQISDPDLDVQGFDPWTCFDGTRAIFVTDLPPDLVQRVNKNMPPLVLSQQKVPQEIRCPNWIQVHDARLSYALIQSRLDPPSKTIGIHPTVNLLSYVSVGQQVDIGPYTVLGENGLSPNYWRDSVVDTPHQGSIRIGDHTKIWSHCVIIRGVFGATRIGKWCRIGAQVQIGHGCQIGDWVSIAPGVMLAGQAHVGNDCWIGMGALVRESVTIGAGSFIGMGSVVVSDIPSNSVAYGNPARVVESKQRMWSYHGWDEHL